MSRTIAASDVRKSRHPRPLKRRAHQALVEDSVFHGNSLRHLVEVPLEDVKLRNLLNLLVAHEPEADALAARAAGENR